MARPVVCHLPESQHLKNLPGIDGSGLCVFTAIDLAARWSNEPALIGFRDFMTKFRGGGWPAKVDEFLPKMAASKGRPTPGYLQHTGGDAEFLRRALKMGRIVCVTYDGRDGVFYRTRIAHMVNLVHLSENRRRSSTTTTPAAGFGCRRPSSLNAGGASVAAGRSSC